MTITIKLKYTEKMKLLELASTKKNKGHWGSSSFLIPEEENLVSIIEKCEDQLEISYSQLSLLLNWISEGTSGGQYMIEEESKLINQIYEAINNQYISLKEEYDETLISIVTTIETLNKFNTDQSVKFDSPEVYYKNRKLLDRIENQKIEIKSLELENLKLQRELQEIKQEEPKSSLNKLFSKKKNKSTENNNYDEEIIMKEKKKKPVKKQKAPENKDQGNNDSQTDMTADELYNNAKKQAKKLKNKI